jgi:hypothetical protein
MQLQPVFRVTTFVPPEHLDSLLEAVAGQASLTYGPYDMSAWWSAIGTEQFKPRPGAKPSVGEVGRVERVPTVRLEFVIPRDPDLLDRVLKLGLLANHPWQEPAVFIDESTVTISNPS